MCGSTRLWHASDIGTTCLQVTTPDTRYVSFHRYGNSGCSKYTNARTLLSDPDWNSGDFEFIARLAPLIEAEGKQLVWSEGNALSCGGKDGVSNSFAASLWILDNLFESAIRGVKLVCSSIALHAARPRTHPPTHICVHQMNVHSDPSHNYSPFLVSKSGLVTVLPVFYGMLAFHR